MTFEIGSAFLSGVVAAAVISSVALLLNRTRLSGLDVFLLHGSLLTGDLKRARLLGAFMHVVVGGGFFGALYVGLFSVAGANTSSIWWWGAMLGAAHGFLAGILMDAMELFHPRVQPVNGEIPDTVRGRRPAAEAGPAETDSSVDSSKVAVAPGPFGVQYGALAPAEVIIGHIAFGALVGVVYALVS